MKKVNIYVDGFNFYYGLKDMAKMKRDWRKFYWIDLVKLFEQYLKEDEIIGTVHYFTARPKNMGKTARQNNLMNCNKAINGDKLKLHYGKYQDKTMKCRADDGCAKEFMHWEEKQTDVSLAIKMVEDSHNSDCNKIILVSGDSDFLPPLKLIKNFYKEIELMVLFPPAKYTNSIASLGFPCISMDRYKQRWNKSILDNILEVNGKTYRVPVEWTV
ncbi:NYN domain-containing protein [Flavobacterium sp. GNP001]